MYCVATRNWHHHAKYILHLQHLYYSKVVMQIKIRQHQGMMVDPLHKLHAIASRRREITRKIAHHKRPTPKLEHSHYTWASTWSKTKNRHQQLILLTQTGSSWTPTQSSVPSETIVLYKTSNPVMQDRNSGHTQMVDTKTTTTPQL